MQEKQLNLFEEQPSVEYDPKKPIIHKLLQEHLHTRYLLGKKRYGTPLQPNNGRDALRDALEEALDLCYYLTQAIYERDSA